MPETWIATLASGRSMEKLATLLTTSGRDLAGAEGVVEALALLDRRLAGDDLGAEPLGHLVELVEVLPDDERRLAGVLLGELLDDGELGVGARREAVALLGLAHGIRHPLAVGEA